MTLEWMMIPSLVVRASGDESDFSSIGIAHALIGVTVRTSSTPSRRIRIWIGCSPLLRTNLPIHPAVSERGTGSLLNVRRWSPGLIPVTAAGEVSATDNTVACVQLTDSASWVTERYLRGRLATVPA